jgi:hypothetical protein
MGALEPPAGVGVLGKLRQVFADRLVEDVLHVVCRSAEGTRQWVKTTVALCDAVEVADHEEQALTRCGPPVIKSPPKIPPRSGAVAAVAVDS